MAKRLLICSLFVALFTYCNHQDDKIAPDRTFYYSVTSPSDSASDLVNFLNKNLNNKRVAITNQSGLAWPYFEVLDPNEELPLDSLMPPHYYVHLLKEKGNNKIEAEEYLVDIRVMIEQDTLPNYELFTYRMDTLGLELSAKTGIHYIDPRTTSESAPFYDTFLKSIVRYSFK